MQQNMSHCETIRGDVLTFWFEQLEPAQWWVRNDEIDATIVARFASLHEQARRCELYQWRATAHGRLAEILLLDQFSRNIFRDSPLAFANDALALALAQEAIAQGADKALTPTQRVFLYLPFMHSESLQIHEVALALYQSLGLQDNLDFEIKHKAIIERFGRFPHRNVALGRASTEQELEFLKQPGSSF